MKLFYQGYSSTTTPTSPTRNPKHRQSATVEKFSKRLNQTSLLVMDQVTKNAPFGTDNTPKIEYKIVAGKRVEILAKVDSTKGFNKRSSLNFNGPELGPHGTPPMQTQPFFREYEFADLQKGYNTAKQHDIARKVTSYTSPFGDRTRSFRHGPPTLNKHTVLPPIGASQPPGNDFVTDVPTAKELQKSPETTDASTALEIIVSRNLKHYPVHKISVNDMYIELSSFDRELTGYVNENQLGLVVLRHNLPLKLSTLKMIYKKFADPRDPRMVNYEKFLQFLLSCLKQSKHDDVAMKKSSSERAVSKQSESSAKTATAKEGLTDILMTCPVDSKFVSMIKEQLAGSDDWDLPQLYTTLSSSDRLHNHQLQADVIMQACVSERVPLTSSILTSMLQQAEIDHGKVDWRQFLAPLACAYIQVYPNRNFIDSSYEPGKIEAQQTELSSRSTNGQHTGWDDSPTRSTNGHHLQSSRDDNDTLTITTNKVSHKDHLSAGWDEREPRGSRNPLHNSAQLDQDQLETPIRDDSWMRNFTRLSHALKSYHPFKTDQLPRSEVERVVNNYNLIYGLGLTPERIAKAVKMSVTEKSEKNQQENVSVEALLKTLMSPSH